ncbi:alpha-glucosidase mal12 [Ptychographa xylographoides]|nr:alpha-glucosidase mal12 [Ptychographa xylographoides]
MGSLHPSPNRIWWKDGTVYQIWPASYKDSNADGIGDIPGIISTLDYLQDLGIDIIWVSPCYASPQNDMGYDISDYENIYPPYGTVADAEALIQACHTRGMRIIFDLVVNHTSDQHAWFRESRSAKDSPKRDWYIWRPPRYNADGTRQPPNNWRAHFGGSAWEWDDGSGEYYLHLFLPSQPDLNWENPPARHAVYASAVKFWLDKGIDGFRIDTVNMYSKAPALPDAPVVDPLSDLQFAPHLFCNGPRMHEYLREMNTEVLSKYDCMTVGELPHTPEPEAVRAYISARDPMLNMVFQFDMVDLGQGTDYKFETVPYTLSTFKATLNRMQTLTKGTDAWTTAFLENHDQARSISRLCDDSPTYRTRSGKLLALMLATLTGTLFLYQGQEIGMINIPDTWAAADFQDVEAVNYLRLVRERSSGDPHALAEAVRGIRAVGRDNARTPVHWDGSAHAGFTAGAPWMRVHDSYPALNVQQQQGDKDSVLRFWKAMLRLRKEHLDLFVHGDFTLHDPDDETTLTFSKEAAGRTALVSLNMSGARQRVRVPPGLGTAEDRILLAGNVGDGARTEPEWLEPWEGRIYLLR